MTTENTTEHNDVTHNDVTHKDATHNDVTHNDVTHLDNNPLKSHSNSHILQKAEQQLYTEHGGTHKTLDNHGSEFITIHSYLNMIMILAVMIAIMWGGFYILKRLGITKRLSTRKSAGGRMEVMETLAIDQKTKVVLVRRDKQEHLIAINSQGNITLIEGNIKHDLTPINFESALKEESTK